MLFCPVCANVLVSRQREFVGLNTSLQRFECRTCPYVHVIRYRIERELAGLVTKEADDVFGGEDAWEGRPTAETPCPKCAHPKAYYYEQQTRSADEPATLFLRCVECAHQ